MKTCPVCCGRRITAQLEPICAGGNARWKNGPVLHDGFSKMLGVKPLKVIAALADRPCESCAGTGRVTLEKFVKLTGGER